MSTLSRVKPGISNASAKASTFPFNAATSLLPSMPFFQSTNFLPCVSCAFKPIFAASSKNTAICSKSFSTKPRLVIAGAPMRHPPGVKALASPNTAFLFNVMCTESQMYSILDPVKPFGRKSHNTKWFSVPPVTMEYPNSINFFANASAFFFVCT